MADTGDNDASPRRNRLRIEGLADAVADIQKKLGAKNLTPLVARLLAELQLEDPPSRSS